MFAQIRQTYGRNTGKQTGNQIQSKFGQEDAPGGHKTLGSEKSIDLAEDTTVAIKFELKSFQVWF